MNAISFITPQIAAKAETLYHDFRLAPESRLRAAHTETMWFYRTYQGGDPIGTIDWRQSARSHTLLVRAHEPIAIKTCLFTLLFAPQDFDGDPTDRYQDFITVLLALAHALATGGRTVGWITHTNTRSKTRSLLPDLFQNGLRETYDAQKKNIELRNLLPVHYPAPSGCPFASEGELKDDVLFLEDAPQGKFIILGALRSDDRLQKALRDFSARGFQGLLFLGETAPNTLQKTAKNAQWPVIACEHGSPPSTALAQLFQTTFPNTR